MNTLLPICLALVIAIPVTTVSAQHRAKELVEVIFLPEIGPADLDSIQAHLKAYKIDLQVNSTEYDDGLLTAIDFLVSTPNGKGSAQGTVERDKKLGFRYDPSRESEFTLAVGYLEEK